MTWLMDFEAIVAQRFITPPDIAFDLFTIIVEVFELAAASSKPTESKGIFASNVKGA